MYQSILKLSLLTLAIFFTLNLSSQIAFGVKAGLHSYDLDISEVRSEELRAGIQESSFGFHLGLYSRIKLGGLYVEPSAILNNISAKYQVAESDELIEEGSLILDIPVMVGFNILMVDIFAGPVAHLRFSGYDDLISLGEYDDNYSAAHFGLQLGAGVNLGKLGFDLRYEKNFKDRDLGIVDTLREIKLVDSNSRILVSISYRL